ncbi:tetratricopeptide repeat protein [Pelagicoccus sp. SDUM812003]|uniref:tetratricopeptide repeat protein n=1 Tax=Pelagicoccus sp. SDUM812003 TaxID=3041267 RepID=UPI00280F15FC|nr:tetratricopeptide repeat protein [Pelagicoccus sp. SDUM812003]MDQ8204018.1 tetratricopeptide repeat protein [Pelagicoccus sp. SDUM812003]
MSPGFRSSRLRHAATLALLFALALVSTRPVMAVDFDAPPPNLDTARKLYESGNYQQAIDYATNGQELDPWISTWEVIKSRSLLALGRYEDAYRSLSAFVDDRQYELLPRLLLREACLYTARYEEARSQYDALGFLVNEYSRRYGYNPEDIVSVGRIAELYEVEPKIVLESFYRRAQELRTAPASAFLAAGDLALDKHDYQLASKTFQQGLESFPENPDLWHGLAESFREDDRSKLAEYASRALEINPKHTATLCLLAENHIAAESYPAAETLLDMALQTNPLSPHALSLKASIAYIKNDNARGDELRAAALSTWTSNPSVDYQIGLQLSRKYRFEDAATSQRIALSLDETFTPARIQLAQDLLRLARNEEAWKHAERVYREDPYNIAAYNLVTLEERLSQFATLESERFLVRMSSTEAPIYGQRVLNLLENAYATLSERYGIELPLKTTVEIYPNPADFETRTFGMPGTPGFLGVCFGPVFTINSPASRANNWEAVLYHEFCHSITLTLSQNRMPRWLSEGISVYEERLANPAWGQRMSANYRDRILSGAMQTIGDMSSAFLKAEDGEDIQFAYFQSYLVVDFLIREHGMEAMRGLLADLGEGVEVNQAIAKRFAPLPQLDEAFASFAQEQARQLAGDYRFSPPDSPFASALLLLQPKKDYRLALQDGRALLEQGNWEQAVAALEPLVAEAGYLPGEENAHWPLARAYRELGQEQKEIETLRAITRHEAGRLGPVERLLELSLSRQDSESAFKWANAWIAINPMAETPWRALLRSAIDNERSDYAAEAARSLIALNPPDKPSLHYQLAELLQTSDAPAAKRHVMLALQDAPRFQKAYLLLDKLQKAIAAENRQTQTDPLNALDLDNNFFQ